METWRSIPNYPKYLISDMGNVKSIRGNILRPFDRQAKNLDLSRRGYQTVHLVGVNTTSRYDNKLVHALVLETFVGPRPDGLVINHINGIKWDNRLENLEYCTVSYNRKQDFITGRQSLSGEKNTQAKLTEKNVKDIVALYKTGNHSYRTLSKKFNVHRSGIANIMLGHCWSYLTGIKKKY